MTVFRHDQTLTDYGTGQVFVGPAEKLREAQAEARRKQQREYARLKRKTDRAWVERRNAYMRKYRAKAPSTKEENPHDPRNPSEHGTVVMYKRHGCRCPRCTMANRDDQRVYRTGDAGPEHNLK